MLETISLGLSVDGRNRQHVLRKNTNDWLMTRKDICQDGCKVFWEKTLGHDNETCFVNMGCRF